MNKRVTWSLSSLTRAPITSTISQDGILSISNNEENSTLFVTATSDFDKKKFDQATVTVTTTPKVLGINVSPKTVSLTVSSEQRFTANVQAVGGASTAVNWSLNGNNSPNTSININGVLSVAGDETAVELDVIATSVFDPSVFDEADVIISQPTPPSDITVKINGFNFSTSKIEEGDTDNVELTASLVGDTQNKGVTWSLEGDSGANLTQVDAFHANVNPGSLTANKTFTIRATSIANPAKSATITFIVTQPPFINLTPSEQSIETTQIGSILLNYRGPVDTSSIQWSISPNNPSTLTIAQDKQSCVINVGAQETADELIITATASTEDGSQTLTATSKVNVIKNNQIEYRWMCGFDEYQTLNRGVGIVKYVGGEPVSIDQNEDKTLLVNGQQVEMLYYPSVNLINKNKTISYLYTDCSVSPLFTDAIVDTKLTSVSYKDKTVRDVDVFYRKLWKYFGSNPAKQFSLSSPSINPGSNFSWSLNTINFTNTWDSYDLIDGVTGEDVKRMFTSYTVVSGGGVITLTVKFSSDEWKKQIKGAYLVRLCKKNCTASGITLNISLPFTITVVD